MDVEEEEVDMGTMIVHIPISDINKIMTPDTLAVTTVDILKAVITMVIDDTMHITTIVVHHVTITTTREDIMKIEIIIVVAPVVVIVVGAAETIMSVKVHHKVIIVVRVDPLNSTTMTEVTMRTVIEAMTVGVESKLQRQCLQTMSNQSSVFSS